jgi:hypothetical protein
LGSVKTCTACKQTKALDQFPLQKKERDGRHNHCKACRAEAQRKRRNPAFRIGRGFNTHSISEGVACLEVTKLDGTSATILVSESDLPKLKEFGHSWTIDSKGYGAAGGRTNYKSWRISMHRFLLEPPADMDIDHINGIRTDNRRENLRIVTRKENIHAMRARQAQERDA